MIKQKITENARTHICVCVCGFSVGCYRMYRTYNLSLLWELMVYIDSTTDFVWQHFHHFQEHVLAAAWMCHCVCVCACDEHNDTVVCMVQARRLLSCNGIWICINATTTTTTGATVCTFRVWCIMNCRVKHLLREANSNGFEAVAKQILIVSTLNKMAIDC